MHSGRVSRSGRDPACAGSEADGQAVLMRDHGFSSSRGGRGAQCSSRQPGRVCAGRSRWSPWSAGQYVTGVIPTRFSASVAAVTVVVRWKMRCGGRSLRVRGLVLLGNRRIAGLRGGRTCLCVRGEGDRRGGGDESACLKRLLPQRIQVLLLPVLLECVADKGDHCSGNSDHNEYHDHACRRIRRLRRGRRTGGGCRTG